MSSRLKENLSQLKNLYKSSGKNRKSAIDEASDGLIGSLCDCAENILKGNVPLTKGQFTTLKPFRKHLRTLTQRKISKKKKRSTLQRGGFIGALLKPIIKLLFPRL